MRKKTATREDELTGASTSEVGRRNSQEARVDSALSVTTGAERRTSVMVRERMSAMQVAADPLKVRVRGAPGMPDQV